MTDTTSRTVTDARFLAVLRAVADQVVAETAEGDNGQIWLSMTPYEKWLTEQIEAALTRPAAEADKIRAMLDARTRLGDNLRLIKTIDPEHIRRSLDVTHPLADDLDMLLDFVVEVRKIAKDI